jgi:hypothetical protein
MNYLVKNAQNEIMKLTVVSGVPQLPEGLELVGPESEHNPEGLEISDCVLSMVEVEPEQQILVRAAQAAQDEVLAQEAILDENGAEIAPAIAHQDAVAAAPAIYNTILAVSKLMAVPSPAKSRAKKLAKIREDRKPLLAEADILVNITYDNGSGLAAAKAYRQSLRECTDVFVADMSLLDAVESFVFPAKP